MTARAQGQRSAQYAKDSSIGIRLRRRIHIMDCRSGPPSTRWREAFRSSAFGPAWTRYADAIIGNTCLYVSQPCAILRGTGPVFAGTKLLSRGQPVVQAAQRRSRMCDGEVTCRDGHFTRVNRDSALKALHDDPAKALPDDEVERRKL